MADPEAAKPMRVAMRAPLPRPDATKDFERDPHTFMNQNVYNCERIFLQGQGSGVVQGRIRLEPTPNGSPLDFQVRYQVPPFPQVTVLSHILPMLARPNVGSIDIPRVIPANATAMRHAVTASLSGCSIIVTDHPNDRTRFRVFHDRRENASLLYNNVQMAFDWRDYKGGNIFDVRAAVCMHYTRQGYWVLLMQLQSEDRTQPGRVLRRFTTTQPIRPYDIVVRRPGSYRRPRAMKAFLQARWLALGQLSAFMANKLPLTLQQVNHTRSAAPLLQAANRACREWGKTHADTQPMATRQKLYRLIRRCKDHESVYSVMLAQEAARDHDTIDTTAMARPVRTALNSLDHGNLTTVGEKLAWFEAQYLQSYSPGFLQGFNAFEETTIPGFTSELSSTSHALQDMFLGHSTLSEAAQGALFRRIRIASAAEFSDFISGKSDKFVQLFSEAGGSVNAIPIDNIYSSGDILDKCNHYARCYPLVRAMSIAVAKSEAAVAHLGRRVVALVSNAHSSSVDTQIFEMCLQELHATYPIAGASRYCGLISLKTALQNLGDVPGKAFALNTNNHCMLVAVTESTLGAVRYHFYDPNFGIVSFPKGEQLFQALGKYFVEERYGERYGAFGDKGISEPEFEVVEILNSQLEGIGLSFGMTVDDLSEVERLSDVAEARRQAEQQTKFLPAGTQLTAESQQELELSSTEDRLKEICNGWKSAARILAGNEGLDSNWIPLPCISLDPGILFVNADNLSAEPRWISTDNEAIRSLNDLILGQEPGVSCSVLVDYLTEPEGEPEQEDMA
ncbi:hypothetical protein EV426DRAFT_610210 [Tirmania nivea]|nr:hypothetical protein EV426DRAFT_610210 [Tirmania nivea]